jgi:CAAX protease family protein
MMLLSRYLVTGKLIFPTYALSNAGLIAFFVVCVLGPFLEEVLFRGYILQLLMDSGSKVWAVLMTALLGMLIHVVSNLNPEQMFSIFIAEIIFSAAYIRGGLGAALIVHALVNFMALIQTPFLNQIM